MNKELMQKKLYSMDILGKPLMGYVFKSNKSIYFYDSVSSEIISISLFMKELIKALLKRRKESRLEKLYVLSRTHSYEKVLKGLDIIKSKRQSDNILKELPGDFELSLKDQFHTKEVNLSSLVLEVTQKCNFRCNYCIYGENYINRRKHSKLSMNKDVAFKAIKYFLDNCGSQEPIINFFGGEPLLVPKLIKDCLDYASKINPNIKFTITTNGYLLKPIYYDFIRKFQVRVSISFDGPKLIHDSLRILPGGGGTFDTIIRNLNELYQIDADYFKKNFVLYMTLTDINNLLKISNFLRENPLLGELSISINKITIRGLKKNVDEFKHILPGGRFLKDRLDEYLENYNENKYKLVTVHNAYFYPLAKLVSTRYPLEKISPLNKICTIGDKRLFVDVNGDFRVCEKSQDLPILGNLNRGFDWDAVERMKKDFLSTIKPCKHCWAVRLCNVCWVDVYDNTGKVNKKQKKDICKIRLKEYAIGLRAFMELTEKHGENIFDKFSSFRD